MKGLENPESKKGLTRREVLIGSATALVGFSLAKLSDLILENPEEVRYKVLQEKLTEAQNNLPEGVPISLSITEQGEIIYQHEDQETTNFLNYLSGRGELTEEYLAAALRRDMFKFLRGLGEDIDTQEVRDKLYGVNTKAELAQFYIDNFDWFSSELEEKWRGKEEELVDYRIERKRLEEEQILSKIHSDFYDALWKMYIKAGACPIQIVDSYEELPEHKRHVNGSASSFVFSDKSPRMKIDLTGGYVKLLQSFLIESSHMYSFTHDREAHDKRWEFQKELIGPLNDLSGPEKLKKKRLAYITPGTVEYHDETEVLEMLATPLIPLNPAVEEVLKRKQEQLQSFRDSIE